MPTLLFADNAPDFRAARAEHLSRAGYRVLEAADPATARELLTQHHIDLAILDIRLTDDNDLTDESGLSLAKEIGKSVPTIMLTAFPTNQFVREALRASAGRPAPAVDFVAKSEGAQALLQAVRIAMLKRQVLIIHGASEQAKDRVASIVESLGPQPTILADQLREGRSVVECLDDSASFGFVIVVLSPDDVTELGSPRPLSRLPVARNLFFELGYLFARLGLQKVCALVTAGLEPAVDAYGAQHLTMDDAGAWEKSLASIIVSAGLDSGTRPAS